MRQRGRKSAASLTVVAPDFTSQRLRAPAQLSPAEREVWTEVVNDQPADAFSAVHAPLLETYCRHVVRGRVLAAEIERFSSDWLADKEGLLRYDKLLAMAERESRAASSLATRLRITRQATQDPKTVGRANARMPRAKKPWELDQED
jgi:hypothetical protein